MRRYLDQQPDTGSRMSLLILLVVATTAFNAGRIVQHHIDDEHERISTEEHQ
jgi:hypothetical protein